MKRSALRAASLLLAGAALLGALGGATAGPPPADPTVRTADLIPLGVILPLPVSTTVRNLWDVQANAARNGALMGLDDAARTVQGFAPHLRVANAPTAAAARRAAERLVSVDGVVALVGGVGEGQAAALSEVAEELGVLFFNIGDQSEDLHATCRPMTFHIEPRRSTYLAAMAVELGAAGYESIAVVHLDTDIGVGEAETFKSFMVMHTDATLSTYAVDEETIVFQPVLQAVSDDSADVVVLLLPPEQQDAMLLQSDWIGADLSFRLYPASESQSRYALAAQRLASRLAATPRIALWDTSLVAPDPGPGFNERFVSRFGDPADPSAWAAYVAVRLVFEAIHEADSVEPQALASYLLQAWPGDVEKPSAARFRESDHQLLQDLYVVEVDPDSPWTIQVSSQVGLAHVRSVIDAGALHGTEGDRTEACLPTE